MEEELNELRSGGRRERKKEDFKRGGNADGYWRILGTWETVENERERERGRFFLDGVSLIFQDYSPAYFSSTTK